MTKREAEELEGESSKKVARESSMAAVSSEAYTNGSSEKAEQSKTSFLVGFA